MEAISFDSRLSDFSRHTHYDIHVEGEGLFDMDFNQSPQKTCSRRRKLSDQSLMGETDVDEKKSAIDLTPWMLTEKDSNDPSYTNLVLPYTVVCRQRYRRARFEMENQFLKELSQHEAFQNNALDGVRVHREFCKSIITPPKPEELIKLTEKQKRKIEEIMTRQY